MNTPFQLVPGSERYIGMHHTLNEAAINRRSANMYMSRGQLYDGYTTSPEKPLPRLPQSRPSLPDLSVQPPVFNYHDGYQSLPRSIPQQDLLNKPMPLAPNVVSSLHPRKKVGSPERPSIARHQPSKISWKSSSTEPAGKSTSTKSFFDASCQTGAGKEHFLAYRPPDPKRGLKSTPMLHAKAAAALRVHFASQGLKRHNVSLQDNPDVVMEQAYDKVLRENHAATDEHEARDFRVEKQPTKRSSAPPIPLRSVERKQGYTHWPKKPGLTAKKQEEAQFNHSGSPNFNGGQPFKATAEPLATPIDEATPAEEAPSNESVRKGMKKRRAERSSGVVIPALNKLIEELKDYDCRVPTSPALSGLTDTTSHFGKDDKDEGQAHERGEWAAATVSHLNVQKAEGSDCERSSSVSNESNSLAIMKRERDDALELAKLLTEELNTKTTLLNNVSHEVQQTIETFLTVQQERDSLSAAAEEHGAERTRLESEVAVLREDLTSREALFRERLAAEEIRYQAMQTETGGNLADMKKLGVDKTALEEENAKLQARITALEKEKDELRGPLIGLTGDKANLQARIRNLEEENQELSAIIQGRERETDGLKARLSTLQSGDNETNAWVRIMEDEQDTLKARIVSLTAEKDSIQKRSDKLERKAEKAKNATAALEEQNIKQQSIIAALTKADWQEEETKQWKIRRFEDGRRSNGERVVERKSKRDLYALTKTNPDSSLPKLRKKEPRKQVAVICDSPELMLSDEQLDIEVARQPVFQYQDIEFAEPLSRTFESYEYEASPRPKSKPAGAGVKSSATTAMAAFAGLKKGRMLARQEDGKIMIVRSKPGRVDKRQRSRSPPANWDS